MKTQVVMTRTLTSDKIDYIAKGYSENDNILFVTWNAWDGFHWALTPDTLLQWSDAVA